MEKQIKDVHTEHCCVLHGCKYGDDDVCTVVTKRATQSYVCESCDVNGIENMQMLLDILNNNRNTCPHCGHII